MVVSRGFLIAVEGVDGCGKDTQAKELCKMLRGKAWLTKEPWEEEPIGALIREQALSGKMKLPTDVLQGLFALNRARHYRDEIKPRLSRGINVVTTRYDLSSMAYAEAGGVLAKKILSLHEIFGIPHADLTFLLRVSAETAVKRTNERGTKREIFDGIKKQSALVEAYDRLAPTYPNVVVIDAERTPKEVTEQIRSELKSFFGRMNQRGECR